ncbi:MAG: TRAPP subunit [Icmadophila ericetorum]|nr:TRAPP subunit [Icmadophila ericetorum]
MSYYFTIIGTKDNPLFEIEFGTSKQGGDGVARFSAEARRLNPFVVHASLDVVEEVQWIGKEMYLKRVDHFASSHISCFLTPTSTKFMLLHLPHPPNTPPPQISTSQNSLVFPPFAPFTTTNPPSSLLRASASSGAATGGTATIPNNPTSPQTEEALRLFFNEVFEAWVKAIMNPFQGIDKVLASPVFRQRILTAGKKFL